jgi:transposase
VPEPKKEGQDEAIGRSKGGLSTKIHATTDALGSPTGFLLTPGQASDLEGADALLADLKAQTLLADKAYDADERVLDPLQQAGKTAVIPPKRNRVVRRSYDQELYKERHLIGTSSANSNSFVSSPLATTKPLAISWRLFIWPQPSSGLIEDTP